MLPVTRPPYLCFDDDDDDDDDDGDGEEAGRRK